MKVVQDFCVVCIATGPHYGLDGSKRAFLVGGISRRLVEG